MRNPSTKAFSFGINREAYSKVYLKGHKAPEMMRYFIICFYILGIYQDQVHIIMKCGILWGNQAVLIRLDQGLVT